MTFATFAKKHLFLKKSRKTIIRKSHLVKKEKEGSVLDFKLCQLKCQAYWLLL